LVILFSHAAKAAEYSLPQELLVADERRNFGALRAMQTCAFRCAVTQLFEVWANRSRYHRCRAERCIRFPTIATPALPRLADTEMVGKRRFALEPAGVEQRLVISGKPERITAFLRGGIWFGPSVGGDVPGKEGDVIRSTYPIDLYGSPFNES
jgi:hypothetical protein